MKQKHFDYPGLHYKRNTYVINYMFEILNVNKMHCVIGLIKDKKIDILFQPSTLY